MISNHLFCLSKSIDNLVTKYENIIILGDLNSEIQEDKMREFSELYCLKNLVNDPTCYKNPQNPSCIDLILTNRPNSFQHTMVIGTGLSDFHKLTLSVLKTSIKKQPPKVISYRDYKHYSPIRCRTEFEGSLYNYVPYHISNDNFVHMFMTILNKHAPINHKYIRANDNLFVTKEMRKAIMTRSKLRNRYYKLKTIEAELAYKRPRNICTTLLKKSTKKHSVLFYCDHISTFEELLLRYNSVSIHTRNIQILGIELYTAVNGLSLAIMGQIFLLKESRIYSSEHIFKSKNIRTTTYGIESLRYLRPPKDMGNSS